MSNSAEETSKDVLTFQHNQTHKYGGLTEQLPWWPPAALTCFTAVTVTFFQKQHSTEKHFTAYKVQ